MFRTDAMATLPEPCSPWANDSRLTNKPPTAREGAGSFGGLTEVPPFVRCDGRRPWTESNIPVRHVGG
jgi:hypothetical protein